MIEITGGELFARGLQVEGIEFLFGLPSPEVDPSLAQLESHGIRQVPGSANLPPGVVSACTRACRCSSSRHNTA